MAFFLPPAAMMIGRAALRYGLPALVRTGQNIMRGRGLMQPGAYRGLKPGGTGKALGKRGLQTLGIADLGFGGLGAFDVAQGLRGIDRPEDGSFSMYGAAEPQQRVVQGIGDLAISSLGAPELVKGFGLKGKAINRFAKYIGDMSGKERLGRAVGIGALTGVGSEFIPSTKPGVLAAEKILSDPTVASQYPYEIEMQKVSLDEQGRPKAADIKDAEGFEEIEGNVYAIKQKGIADPDKVTDLETRTRTGRNKRADEQKRETFQDLLDQEYDKVVEKEQREKQIQAMNLNIGNFQNPTGQVNTVSFQRDIEEVGRQIDERVAGGDSATLNYVVKKGEDLEAEDNYGSPDPIEEEKKYLDFLDEYDTANKLIKAEKEKLGAAGRETFDEFYAEFKKNAGLDIPDETANYAAYNFFNNLSAPTNATGMAGFAEAVARAGKIYSEDMLQFYQTEKAARAELAKDYKAYSIRAEELRDKAMSDLLKEERANIIAKGVAQQDAIKSRIEYENKSREEYLKNLEPTEKRFSLIIPNPMGKYVNYKTYEVGRSKKTGQGLIRMKLDDGSVQMVPYNHPVLDKPEHAQLKQALRDPDSLGAFDLPIEKSELRTAARTTMSKTNEVLVNVERVLNIAEKFPNLIGPGGQVRLLSEKAIQIPFEIFKSFGSLKEVVSESYSNVDGSRESIMDSIRGGVARYEQAEKEKVAGKAKYFSNISNNLRDADRLGDNAQEKLDQLNKGKDVSYLGYKSTQSYKVKTADGVETMSGKQIIELLAELQIIETRMKYLLANVYKDKDRLTVFDLKEMERNTEVVTFGKTPTEILGAYKKIKDDMMIRYQNAQEEAVMLGSQISEIAKPNHVFHLYKNNVQKAPVPKQGEKRDDPISNDQLIEDLKKLPGGAILEDNELQVEEQKRGRGERR